MMKTKVLTVINVLLVFLPWTILLLRMNAWALQSPAAEIIIGCYCGEMLLGSVFSVISYLIGGKSSKLMQACLVVNVLYGAAALFLGAWMAISPWL